MSAIDISIIVPMHNTGAYITECLESLARQKGPRLEVIVVDDGSTDESPDLAKRFVDSHDGFSYYRTENHGPGAARNFGIERAKGAYLAFVDSDDLVIDDMYAKLFAAAQRNDSELVTCNACRFTSTRTYDPALLVPAFHNLPDVTTLRESPGLLYDTTTCNKLISRGFYQSNGIEFPTDILYEDIPVAISLHFLANRVSVIHGMGYYWRTRDGINRSITQQRKSLNNIKGRIEAINRTEKFLISHDADQELLDHWRRRILSFDIPLFLIEYERIDEASREDFTSAFAPFIDERISQCGDFDSLPALAKEKIRAFQARDYDKLIKLRWFERKDYPNSPVSEREGRLYGTFPSSLFEETQQDITDELMGQKRDTAVESVAFKKGVLTIKGRIYTKRVNTRRGDQSLRAWLCDELTGERHEIAIRQTDRPELTEKHGTFFDEATGTATEYDCSGAGFEAAIDVAQLAENADSGDYLVMIDYENRVGKGSEVLRSATAKAIERINNTGFLSGNIYTRPHFSRAQELYISISRKEMLCENVSCSSGRLALSVSGKPDSIFAKSAEGETVIFEREASGAFAASSAAFAPRARYAIYAQNVHAEPERVLCAHKRLDTIEAQTGTFVCSSIRTHELHVSVFEHVAIVENASARGTVLDLTVSEPANATQELKPRQAELLVADPLHATWRVLASTEIGRFSLSKKLRFSIDFSHEEIVCILSAGEKRLQLRLIDKQDKAFVAALFAPRNIKETCESKQAKVIFSRSAEGDVRLTMSEPWPTAQDTRAKRKSAAHALYPQYLEEPLRENQVLFSAAEGARYEGNPRAFYEYLIGTHSEYHCIWALENTLVPIKGPVERVRKDSPEYWHALGTSKYLIIDGNLDSGFVKRTGQIVVQTTQGTPLKKVGLDNLAENRRILEQEEIRRHAHEWDYLVVQGGFTGEIAANAFDFHGEVLRTGFPRTDCLFTADDERRGALRAEMGIPSGKKVILYAPTWRSKKTFSLAMDFKALHEQLGDDYIFLVRIHPTSCPRYSLPTDYPYVCDVTEYGRIEDLYLLADILVTDYSSALCDFLLTDKTAVLFAYDLEEYAQNLRGLYLDLAAEAPCPLVSTNEELADAIANVRKQVPLYEQKMHAFREKYLAYENERSSELIFEKVFGKQA